MRQHKDRQLVSIFEIIEVYHQPSCRIAFFHGTAQVSKIINNEYPTGGLLCNLLYTADNGFLKVGIQQGIAVKRYTIQLLGKGVEVAMLVGITELELLF